MTHKEFRHVLLADDDLDDCEFFSDVFKTEFTDVKLTVSNDGNKLMAVLKGPPTPEADLIFLDLNMPMLSGPQCLEKIRASLELNKHIVVIFSTSSDPADILKMYSLGANYFITKPAEYNHLSKLIGRAMDLVSQTGAEQPAFEKFYIAI
ncbi:response regulator [Flavobacterium sp. YJ01]|uniref:response regulator n=1 Tax=unclassified Flavobacterium TaxID=196869 RepID=UPI0023E361D6|nr:response regulator [Flavobacterium sp. YJ01]WET02436.1 response regulator [Flavobacterium sp. YJ01]